MVPKLFCLFLLTGALATREKSTFFTKLHARLPVFRDGPILTGGSYKIYKEFVRCFCHFQGQSGALLHAMVALMNNVAHHARDVFGVGVGWGRIIANVVVF